MWRCDLPPDADVDRLTAALVAEGYRLEESSPLLRILRDADEDAIVIVPRTGRVQIRVSYLVAPEGRAARARDTATRLARHIAARAPADPEADLR